MKLLQHVCSTAEQPFVPLLPPDAAVTGTANLRFSGEERQPVHGFGVCFNELGWEALCRLALAERERVLDSLFSPTQCGLRLGRVPIGGNDFSLDWYSCDETPGDTALEHFSVARDRLCTLPFLREAQRRQPSLEVFASPWSPPTWMKTPPVYSGGRLRQEPEILKAYAAYLLRFLEAYRSEGVPIRQIFVQNEPMANQKFPSCLWNAEEMRRFIGEYFGPALAASDLDTELWLGTVNGPDKDIADSEAAYPLQHHFSEWVGAVLEDPAACAYIRGIGLQWGGRHLLAQLRAAYPELPLMQTEAECGSGNNSWAYAEYLFDAMWQYFSFGAQRYVYWNPALLDGQASTWGWKQNALVTVTRGGHAVFNPDFWLLRHLSSFLADGAVYLPLAGALAGEAMAFRNPDGRRVLVISNSRAEARRLSLADGERTLTVPLPPHSLHTLVLK